VSQDTPTLLLTPRRNGLIAGRANQADVLVRVQAPQPAAASPTRNRLNLALVIDRSGSMQGRPLEEAKRAVLHVIEGLAPDDRVAVVVYDNDVQVIVPATLVEDRERIPAGVRAIRSGGSTNLHGGWLAGAEEVSRHAAAHTLSRVILLSDGMANHGLIDLDAIVGECASYAARGITTSTYGLGERFNEDLMTAMARAAHGQAEYGETAEDLHEPLQTELALLNATCAKSVTVRIRPHRGVEVKLRNDYPETSPGAWRLPNLAYGSEAWALLKVAVFPTAPANIDLADVSLSWEDLDGMPYELSIPPLILRTMSESEWNLLREDQLVARRLGELEAAEIQEEARQAVHRGDWTAVDRLLGKARELGKTNPWIAAVVESLGDMASERKQAAFLKEAMYAARHMKHRLASVRESLDGDLATDPSFLRRRKRHGKGS